MGLHGVTITDHGPTIGERMEGTTGVLGWSPLRTTTR